MKITQQINFWRFKRALWSGPYCTFSAKMPNRCAKNEQFAKHLKKNCFFFGTEKFKNRSLEKYKYHIEKNTCLFLSSIERRKKFSAIKDLIINLTWNHSHLFLFQFNIRVNNNNFRTLLLSIIGFTVQKFQLRRLHMLSNVLTLIVVLISDLYF